ncbi:MAG TPA: tyrosine-type recombinase/integrase [Gemmatimonadaceae bacterium]|nr:tyrosine-type recombinase/integrase [Gemmatimonadaceae bacterium]
MSKKLTHGSVAQLPAADKPYYVTDSLRRGLQLRVALDGSKSWSLRYRIGRRMRRLTLGDADTLSLADARARAKVNMKLVSDGIDPAEVKQERRSLPTVEDFATVYIEKHAQPKLRRWKGVKSRLDNDVLPTWRHKLMKDITRRDVRELIDGIAARPAPISANRVRSLLHKLFNVAIQLDVVEANPVSGTARPGVEQRRDRVLTSDELRRFWTACDAMSPEMAAAWRLRLLTAQRANEVHNLAWRELDLDAGWWTLPAERSKNGLSHRVPLSPPAMILLKALRADADALVAARAARDDTRPKAPVYVLAQARGAKQRAAAAATFGLTDFKGHDLRRTAASLMTGSGTPQLVVSKILNHAEPGVTFVYDRHSYDAEKRLALDGWARTLTAILEQQEANVLTFARS